MGYSGPKYLQTQTLPAPLLVPAVPGPKCSFVSVPGYAVFPRGGWLKSCLKSSGSSVHSDSNSHSTRGTQGKFSRFSCALVHTTEGRHCGMTVTPRTPSHRPRAHARSRKSDFRLTCAPKKCGLSAPRSPRGARRRPGSHQSPGD
jgi:hypothetical protein